MADNSWANRAQKLMMAYFYLEWLQVLNLVFYFIIEILLSVFLTLLPIKLAFNWLLQSVPIVQHDADIIVVVIFAMHIYLYLNYKLSKMVRNPQIQKKLLFQNKVVKMQWLNIVTPQLIYDLICLAIAIYVLSQTTKSLVTLLLELVYLPKIYKIKMFNDRIQSYIIGTSFYIIYNVFYGLFILIILVSYVASAFYLIDYIYYQNNYDYPELLWIKVSQSWNNIIQENFGVQLLYSVYWSLGTASAAAYGDLSASAPPDVVYNILCLYFEGFLFGFYLSRIHSLPETINRKQNQLLQIFQKFEEHNNQIRDRGQHISEQLYFKILCSLEYQESRKKSLNYIEGILPQDYIIEIKTHIFVNLINLNPMNLWPDDQLRQQLCLNINQLTTEVGEEIYQYNAVDRTDLIFLNSGSIHSSITLDHSPRFHIDHHDGDMLGTYNFVTNLITNFVNAKLQSYSVLYILKRSVFKSILSVEQLLYFSSLFESMITLNNNELKKQSLGLYVDSLAEKGSDVPLFTPQRKAEYVQNYMAKHKERYAEPRKVFRRKQTASRKWINNKLRGKISVGVQCDSPEDHNSFEIVLIL